MTLSGTEFTALYHQARGPLRRYVRRRVSTIEQMEDVCADVFELAYRKLPVDHPHPLGWLVRAAGILIAQTVRLSERERVALRDHVVVYSSEADPRLLELDSAWSTLSERHREVLRLTIWDGLSAAEAAVVLGCSEQAAWQRVSRARAALRAAWPTTDLEEEAEVKTYG